MKPAQLALLVAASAAAVALATPALAQKSASDGIAEYRKKLEDGSGGQELIRTIRNEGYMFTAKVTRL